MKWSLEAWKRKTVNSLWQVPSSWMICVNLTFEKWKEEKERNRSECEGMESEKVERSRRWCAKKMKKKEMLTRINELGVRSEND